MFTASQPAHAQAWMQGYNFRKKIAVDKSKVPGALNLHNFNVLIELESLELKYALGCGDGLQHASGLPISFTSKDHPDIPIGFQVDSYDPVAGKLRCWVQVTELIAGQNPGTNEIYFYYGGNEFHNPLSDESRAIWSAGYRQVWHMNFDSAPAVTFSGNHQNGRYLTGHATMTAANFVPGIIGSATTFNGDTDYMHSVADKEGATSISVWIKLRQIGAEQVILANDSAGNGYRLKINAQGKVAFDILSLGAVNSHSSIDAIPVNSWVYLTVFFVNNQKKIYVNGQYRGGGGSPSSNGGTGETLSIGRSKQNNSYFNGFIDELRIAGTEKSLNWMLTEYGNQLHPETFISVSSPEVNPIQSSGANVFIGSNGTANWHDENNWSFGQLPGRYNDVIIPTGKEVYLDGGETVSVNSLLMEQAAKITLSGNLEVNCTAQLAFSSSIHLKGTGRLIFKNDLLNNGKIVSGQNDGALEFRGGQSVQLVSGSGTITVGRLEVSLALPEYKLLLHVKANVSKGLVLLNGMLHTNDQLTLLAGGYNNYAVVMPVDEVNKTGVIGNVNIQQFIDGNFSSPSTARGWWLLSSPVYHAVNAIKEYNLHAIKKSVFVTGPGGIVNGFDPSPNNKPTIYTHNQALPGTLPQKYTGIPRMDVSMPLGKGIFIFSRGNRIEPDAYEHQVQKPPFSNPQPYVFTHTGKLFTGDLKIDVFNNNAGTEGDGYNLLGNPYASPITWGGLQMVNVLPFVWIFDTKNNAYLVTDNPDYVIHAGTGFFVKVSMGSNAGAVTFTEKAKYTGTALARFNQVASIDSRRQFSKSIATEINIDLKKEGLADTYKLILRKNGSQEVTDADAEKIGEGYLSISGLTASGHQLAIDERRIDTGTRVIELFVKGWTTGTYTLTLKMSLNNNEGVVLLDHYLNTRTPVVQPEYLHSFFMDMENTETYGGKRFSLIVEPMTAANPLNREADKAISFYPNPVNELIYFRSKTHTWRNLTVLIRTITGNVIWKGALPLLEPGLPVSLPGSQLVSGLYILQLIDEKTNKTITSFKLIKN